MTSPSPFRSALAPSKPLVIPDGQLSQGANRYIDTFTDQHRLPRFPEGRPWCGWRELAADRFKPNGFVGGDLQPGNHEDPWGSAWDAPWIPEFKYFDFNYKASKISIRYDRVISEDTLARKNYYAAANKIAARNEWPEVAWGSIPRETIIDVLGPMPRDPRLGQAAQAGDRWLLGDQTVEVNPILAKILGISNVADGLRATPLDLATPIVSVEELLAAQGKQLDLLIAEAVAKALAGEREKHRAMAARFKGKGGRKAKGNTGTKVVIPAQAAEATA
jgi:hypothetical protein